jgi:hypothetical protein
MYKKRKREEINCTIEKATKAQRGLEILPYFFSNHGAKWGAWSTPLPGRFVPKNRILLSIVL